MASIPAGYSLNPGIGWFYTDGTGPYAIDSTGTAVLMGGGSGGGDVTGSVAQDAAASAVDPLLIGGYASAAAPSNVSADADAVRAWFLRNGAQVVQQTFAGILQAVGAGAVNTGTPRITIASDDPAVTALATLNTSVNSTSSQLPPATGTQSIANSLSMTPATSATFPVSTASGTIVDLGAQADAAAAADNSTASLIALLKRNNQRLTQIDTDIVAPNADLTNTQTPVAPATATATKGVLAGGQYNSTAPTFTTGQQGSLQLDANGFLKTAPLENSFSNLATNATTTITSGRGVLHSVVINTRGTATTVTLYDNTAGSGTKIATIDTTLSTTAFIYDVVFATGLTAVTAGTTPADITVSYK